MVTRRTALLSPVASFLYGQEGRARMFGNAEAYERFMGRWSRVMAPLFLDFAGVPKAGSVLDVGSGTGAMAFTLAQRRPQVSVTGIDPTPEYVAYAAAKNVYGERVVFQKGDAQQLEFRAGTFDACVSLLVFNFIPDRMAAIREIRRVTRPGGVVAAAVWEYGDGMRMLRVFWDAAIDADPGAERLDEKNMPLRRRGELGRLWREGGLDGVREEPLEIETRFASFADYWEPFLLGQGPAGAYVRTLDRTGVERLRAALKRRLRLTAEDRAFSLPARVLAVRGIVPGR